MVFFAAAGYLTRQMIGFAAGLPPLWDIEKFKNESNSSVGEICEFGFSYNSGTNQEFLTVNDLKKLVKNHI